MDFHLWWKTKILFLSFSFAILNVILNVAGNCETIVETGVERVSLRGREGMIES